MALGFTQTKAEAEAEGRAKKRLQYKMKMGNNSVRLIGGVIPRYVYWVSMPGKDPRPVECLAFDRETQSWARKDHDFVKDYFPDLKANWAYVSLCYDVDQYNQHGAAGTDIQVFNHKSTLFKAIQETAADLGDPTDPETGYDVVFTKKSTGPKPINVSYTLNPLKCQKTIGPIPADMLEKIKAYDSLDEAFPRPEPEKIKEFLEKYTAPAESEESAVDDDIPEQFK